MSYGLKRIIIEIIRIGPPFSAGFMNSLMRDKMLILSPIFMREKMSPVVRKHDSGFLVS